MCVSVRCTRISFFDFFRWHKSINWKNDDHLMLRYMRSIRFSFIIMIFNPIVLTKLRKLWRAFCVLHVLGHIVLFGDFIGSKRAWLVGNSIRLNLKLLSDQLMAFVYVCVRGRNARMTVKRCTLEER